LKTQKENNRNSLTFKLCPVFMDVNNLGTRITKYRTAHKMSQIELARELKVSQSTLNPKISIGI
jgi:predicted transcriptional regulator